MSWNPTHLQVAVQRARNLIAKGKSGTNDVFVTVSLGKEKFHTTTKEKAADPEWYEECDMILPDKYEESRIEIVVSHRNALGMDEFLGRLELPLKNYNIHDPPKSQWYALLPKPGHTKNFKRGELEVRLCYIVAKLKDPDSISTASSASKRLKIGKKMLSSLGEKLHMKKKDKIRDHIPDLTGLDEGVLDDDDIAENYSTAVKVSRKTSDSSSHHEEKPSLSVPPFTKFTPFPKEKSDTRRSPSSSIASEEDLAHKHGDAESENSLEMGHEKPGRGLTRSSGGKPKKLSLGKRGLISKDKSQSVWEISNTKSEFGLAAGLRLTAHSSKEEGDVVGSKRPLVGAAKDLENVIDIPSRADDRSSGSHTHPTVTPGKVGSPNTSSSATSVSVWPSAAVHESVTSLGGTHKIGMAKSELKQTPVLVDDDDDSDYQHSASDALPSGASSSINVKRDTTVALNNLSYDSSLTGVGRGVARVDEAHAPAASNATRKDVVITDASGSSIIEISSTGLPGTTTALSSSVTPPTAVTAAVVVVPDVISSNPFSNASADGPAKGASRSVNSLGVKASSSTDKPRSANPFEDSNTYSAAENAGGNPFEEEGDTIGSELPSSLTSIRLKDTQKAFNPFEENVESSKAENKDGSHEVEPLQIRALDPPAIETVTISAENDMSMKMVVTESATKAVKSSSRKVVAPTAPQAFRMPAQAVARADRGLPAAAGGGGGDAAAPVTTVTSPAGDTRALSAAANYLGTTAVTAANRSSIETHSTAIVSGSSPTTNVFSSPGVKAGSNNNPFEEDNENDHVANERAPVVHASIALSDNLSNALLAVGTTSNSDSAIVKPHLISASVPKKATAPPPPASAMAAAAIASARAVQAPPEKSQAERARVSPDASPEVLHSSATIGNSVRAVQAPPEKSQAERAHVSPDASPEILHSSATIGEAAIGRAALPKPPTASPVEAVPAVHLVDKVSGKSTTEKLFENNRRKLGADSGVTANVVGDGDSERTTVSSNVDKVAAGAQKPPANSMGGSGLAGVSSSKNLEPVAFGKQAALSGNTTSAEGLMQAAVLYGHSLISAVTFKDQSTSTLAPADTKVDSATQTQIVESQENIPPEFKGISKELLVEMVLKMKAQLAAKEGQVRDLEEYIDSLLVRVMDGNPSLLLHTDVSMKRTSGKP